MCPARWARRHTRITAGWATRRRTTVPVVDSCVMGRWISLGAARFGCSERREGRAENNCSAECYFRLGQHFLPPGSVFWVGSVTPRPDISDRLLACRTQEKNAKTLKLFPTFDGARAVPHACQQLKVLRAVGSSRVDLQACKLEYSIVSPK